MGDEASAWVVTDLRHVRPRSCQRCKVVRCYAVTNRKKLFSRCSVVVCYWHFGSTYRARCVYETDAACHTDNRCVHTTHRVFRCSPALHPSPSHACDRQRPRTTTRGGSRTAYRQSAPTSEPPAM